MALKELSASEQELVLQCLKAIVESNEIEDWEFRTRLGITRATVKEIISRWSEIDDRSEGSDEFMAINNSLNETCHGVHWTSQEWSRRFTEPRAKIVDVYMHWLRLGNFRGGLR